MLPKKETKGITPGTNSLTGVYTAINILTIIWPNIFGSSDFYWLLRVDFYLYVNTSAIFPFKLFFQKKFSIEEAFHSFITLQMPGFYMKHNTGIKWVNRIRGTGTSSATLTDNIFTN